MKNNQHRNRPSRKPALTSISVGVLAALISSGVHATPPSTQAADTSFTEQTANDLVNAHISSLQTPINSAAVNATVSGGNVNSTIIGIQQGNSTSLSTNTAAAKALGNVTSQSMDLATIMNGSLNSDNSVASYGGLAALGHAINSGSINSTASNNAMTAQLTGSTTDSAVVDGNTISAATVVNSGVTSIAGTVPRAYTSTAPGSMTIGATPPDSPTTFKASASIVSTSAQQTSGSTSTATATNNSLSLKMDPASTSSNELIRPTAALTNNTVSADIKNNSSNSTLSIDSAAFTGSAVLSNTQTGRTVIATALNDLTSIKGAVSAGRDMTGTLAVTGNAISSSSTGNEAFSSAAIQSFTGQILTTPGVAYNGLNSTSPSATLTADLVIANDQFNKSATLSATTSNGAVEAKVENVKGSTVDVSGNTIAASGLGNNAVSNLASSTNAVSFVGSAALASQQQRDSSAITATTSSNSIGLKSASVNGSSLSLTTNTQSADARGNQISQNLELAATTLTLGGNTTLTASSLNDINAKGPATVSNLQTNTASAVTANNTYSTSLLLPSNTITSATTLVDRNTQSALALSNNADNKLSLNGTTVGTGAGIASVQMTDTLSPVSATLSGASISLTNPTVQSSSLSVTNSNQSASGYGNQVGNALSVTAATVTGATPPTGNIGSTVDALSNGKTVAGYGINNAQKLLSAVTATATSTNAVQIATWAVNSSHVLSEANTFAAQAIGNTANNSLSFVPDSANISSTGFSSLAGLTSTQSVSAAILATAVPGTSVKTSIDSGSSSNNAVDSSTVSASRNQLQALATGSLASNTLAVNANNVATGDTSTATGIAVGAVNSTIASFGLQNVQSGMGSVTATQKTITQLSDVRMDINGSVVKSTLAADGNTSTARAVSNSAANTLGMTAGSGLTSSSALQNVQTTQATVNALIGAVGSAGTPGTPGVSYTDGAGSNAFSGGSQSGNNITVPNGTSLIFDTSAVMGSSLTALNNLLSSLGFTINPGSATIGSGSHYLAGLEHILGAFDRSTGKTTYSFTGFSTPSVPPVAAMPNQGGVTLAVTGAISKSQLSVSGNATNGFTAGNSATNRMSLTGNSIDPGSSSAPQAKTALLAVNADHMVANKQTAFGDLINSEVYGTMAISATLGANIIDSSLTVSNNSQSATAVANTASNSLALQGNSVKAVSALQSNQSGATEVKAASNLELFTPVNTVNSSTLVSGNANSSLAVKNDATNVVNAAGTLVGNSKPGSLVIDSNGSTIAAETVLSNVQQSSAGAVTSAATTKLYNQEAFAGTGTSLKVDGSSLTLSGNTTAAEASANRATNTASLSGASTQAGSVSLGNQQSSSAAVTATALTTAQVILPGSVSGAVNSAVLIDGNSTTALARGNTASNALNSLAGSIYGTALGGTVNASSVAANAGILNNQSNTGAVSATGTGATYQVALNSLNVSSSIGLSNNQVNAQAYGNTATNTMTLNALNTNSPTAAIGNYQINSGMITATANNVTYGTGIPVSSNSTNSNLRTTGNQVTATAVGNSVVSAMLAR